MTIQIRTANNHDEVRAAMQVYFGTDAPTHDLLAGLPPDKAQAETETEFRHWCHLRDSTPEGFVVAEDEGEIVGVAAAVRRPPQWLLTNFYVRSEYQGQRVGQRMLEQAYRASQGCTRFSVHSSVAHTAQTLYIRFGMFPQPHSTVFRGRAARKPDASRRVAVEKAAITDILPELNRLDRTLLGFERPIDHEFWASAGQYYVVDSGKGLAGFFCIDPTGAIGPLAVADSQMMSDVLNTALLVYQDTSDYLEMLVPGANTAALNLLVGYGYPHEAAELLMSSAPLPSLTNVIFTNTDLL